MLSRLPIYLLEAKDQHLLASTFLRFAEYYENPHFRGKIFNLEEFIAWHTKTYGEFNYFEKWGGFNIPSLTLRPFRQRRFNPLSKDEKRFLALWKKIPEPFYIIGVIDKKINLNVIKHEVVHALFYLNAKYRKAVLAKLLKLKTNNMKDVLRRTGYHTAVHNDETNAYAIACSRSLVKFGLKMNSFRPIEKEMRNLFEKFFDWDIVTAKKDKVLDLVHRIPFRIK